MKIFHTKFLNQESFTGENKEAQATKKVRINYLWQLLIWAGIFSVAYFIIKFYTLNV